MLQAREYCKHVVLIWLVLIVQLLHIECFPSTSFRHPRRSRSDTKCNLSINDVLTTFTSHIPFLTEYPSAAAAGGGLALAGWLYSSALPPERLIDETTLQLILENTYMAKQQQQQTLKCIYKASRDGWKANAFHDKVDFRGSGVVVLRTQGGKIVGGYNPNGWRSTDDYTTSTTAFLFCVTAPGRVQKYKVQAGGPALFDYASAGPCFGTTDLLIGPPQAAVLGGFAGPNMENEPLGSLQMANILPGQTYDTDERWPVRGYKIRLQEVEVYCVVDDGNI